MKMLPGVLLFLLAFAGSLIENPCKAAEESRPLEEVYSWKAMDYSWPTPECRDRALAAGDYIPENNALVGVKVWGDRAYLSVPRWLPGVPSTLNWVPASVDRRISPLSDPLTPFPSWDMQEEGNCSAIQYVQGMEIDPMGRMWVLDVGRRNLFTSDPDNGCPPKLLLLDLPSGGSVLHSFIFPEEAASRTKSFLNDLVVDASGGGNGSDWYAYISDAGGEGGAIVVYSLSQDAAWRVADERSMKAESGDASMAVIGGRTTKLRANVDGVALVPLKEEAAHLFYCPLGSFNLYSIPTDVLRRPPSDPSAVSAAVTDWGRRTSQGDGMMMDSSGALYFGLLAQDSVAVWSAAMRLTNGTADPSEVEIVAHDPVRLQWVDGFGFDDSARDLWVVSNRLQNYQAREVDLNETNYRLLRIHTGTRSYMYYD